MTVSDSGERDGVVLEPAIYADIRRAEPGSDLFWELIREAKRLAREGGFDGARRVPDRPPR